MISHVLVYECDYCGHTISDRQQCDLTALSQLSCALPGGWSFVGTKLACPNHVVVVKTIQGKDES